MPIRHLRLAIIAASLATVALTASAVLAAPGPYDVNLVVNGNAETGVGASGPSRVVKPPGWKTTGQFTLVKYGASGGFPDKNSPGPKQRGLNFFAGGNVARSTGTQTIDLSAAAADIDAGSVSYAFSAWLGGFSSQRDNAKATVAFAGADGGALGSATLGPVTTAERQGATGLLLRQRSGAVPTGARSASVTLVSTRFEGSYNDGYIDNVSLVLKKT
jgi:hypothetical protein